MCDLGGDLGGGAQVRLVDRGRARLYEHLLDLLVAWVAWLLLISAAVFSLSF
jgi:hypothetical protein